MAQASLLAEIKDSLALHARSATFACGGSIPINTSNIPTAIFHAISPIQVRFGWNGLGSTLNLPGSDPSSPEFQALLNISLPATFAREGKEVLDEEYRKAGKLDRGHFTTDFCPYEVGIVDTLTQILLPQTKQAKHVQSIKAELYKLNVYSAPSGRFKPHVDTPRSESQLGSLVISLPTDHEGGQLAVRNAGNEVLFDWSQSANRKDSTPCIKWAAFYSDCEHEVLEVTAGHRITLAYNLYVTRGLGHLAGAVASVLDPSTLPLYKTLQTALQGRDFFPKGHFIAVWLSHAYAHTNKNNNFLPGSLKGADMSLYETARALNLPCEIVPVIPNGGYKDGGKVDIFHPDTFGPLVTGEVYDGNGSRWGLPMPRGKYTWINSKGEDLGEAQTAYVVLGSLDMKYSRAAMLIRVPPMRERGLLVDESLSVWSGMHGGGDEDEWGDDDSEEEDDDENSEDEEDEDDEDDEDEDSEEVD